ncbi:R-spondin-4 [Hemicordylus capensis]|uniref:R-spondin-4 n=1 Tax=Hemicordylus capensis TaxID=884348 RepID=UPI002303DDC5|nr:R-spondin-4 [Hemicordylus capensis]
MQGILVLLLLFINSMEMLTQARRKKQVSAALFENCTGCVMCSEDNGCISCQQRLFLLIWRDGIRQYGACVHACPPGYFGLRGQEVNRCIKCKSSSCESCFSKDFCMKCKEQFYLHKGKCFRTCPPNTTAQNSTWECQEKCEMTEWSNWSPCSTNQGRTCGRRWGSASRVREAIRNSKEESAACPVLSETTKCRMKKRCPGEKNENKRKEKRDKKQAKKKKRLEAVMVT